MKKFLTTTVIIQDAIETKYLDLTLQSLLTQTVHPCHFEVIVWGNTEDEEIKRIINFYGDFLKIEMCIGEDCKNNYLNKSESDICLLVKSGIFLSKNCIEEHQKEHQKSSDKIIVLGYVEEEVSAKNNLSKTRYDDFREEHYSRYGDRIDLLPAPWLFFSSSNVSVARTELLMNELFDKNYDGDHRYQDMDLGFRLCKMNNKMLLNRTAMGVDHVLRMNDTPVSKGNNERNRCYFHGKYNTMETQMLKNIPSDRLMYLNDHIIQFFE